MTTGPQHDKQESNHLGASQLSLRTLFIAVFLAACFSRFTARFGIGVLVLVGWASLTAAIVSLTAASAVALVDLMIAALSRHRPPWSLARSRFARCIFAGTLVGLTIQSLFVAYYFSLVSPQMIILNSWSKGIAALSSVFRARPIELFMLYSPALLAAFSIAIARAIANRKASTSQSIAPTGCLLATMFGVAPIVLLILIIVWLVLFPPPPRPPDSENMLGLLPIAIPIWCAMGAAFGGALGVAAATLLTLLNYARTRCRSNLLWSLAILAAILITEATVRGWVGKAYLWWSKVDGSANYTPALTIARSNLPSAPPRLPVKRPDAANPAHKNGPD